MPEPVQESSTSRLRSSVELGLHIFAFILALGFIALVVAPIFKELNTYGVHDWDAMEAYRFLPVKTLKSFHQMPFWDPYNCGGHTWWAGPESGSNLVSLWFPTYMLLSFPHALRVEVVGTALLGVLGMWFLASRFTKSPGLRLLCAAVFLDGRWALQVSVGHAWHLYYAWTPWALLFLDRAVGMREPVTRSPRRDVILLAVVLAMMVYNGGIYPLPQTVLLLSIYASTCALLSRSWIPLVRLAASGVLSLAFAAPRLFPLMEMLRRFPRLVDSPEELDLGGLIDVFTAKDTQPHSQPPWWGWHEWGIYVGWIPFLAMLAALIFARRARERALAAGGLVCALLGLGRFSVYSPWAIAHDHIPIFESQHVPSRWLYPAAMVLIVAMCAILERWVSRFPKRTWLEVGLIFFGAYVALDIGLEAQRPLVGAFVRHLPNIADTTAPFRMEKTAPANLRFDVTDWAPTSMPLMIANVGALDCATFPGLHTYYRRAGHMTGVGAKAIGETDYRGEAYVASGPGFADVVTWSPNVVTVRYRGVQVGDYVMLNQNWDTGWRANGVMAANVKDAVGARVTTTDGEITFRYVPKFFITGCLICATVIALLFWLTFSSRGKYVTALASQAFSA